MKCVTEQSICRSHSSFRHPRKPVCAPSGPGATPPSQPCKNHCSKFRTQPVLCESGPSNLPDNAGSDPSPNIAEDSNSTESYAGPVCSTALRITWWNICHVSSVWFDDAFWGVLSAFDIVFLVETHHTHVPIKPGWNVAGLSRDDNSKSGGVLILSRAELKLALDIEYPFDDFVWVRVQTDSNFVIWIAGAYLPGSSDPRFRSLQGIMQGISLNDCVNKLPVKLT